MKKILFALLAGVLVATGMVTPAQASGKVIFLTFDDGPSHPADTEAILSALHKYNAKATFFMLGTEVKAHPSTFNKVVAAGHRIANHTWDHTDLTTLSNSKIRSEISRTQTVEGKYRSSCVRPPYGATNSRVAKVISDMGLKQKLWDIDTRDWERPSAQTVSNRVTSHAYNGAVVLMHDGGGDGDNTAKALLIMLPKLKKMGYTFKVMSC